MIYVAKPSEFPPKIRIFKPPNFEKRFIKNPAVCSPYVSGEPKCTKKEEKENGNKIEEVTAFKELPRPIWTLTVKKLESYFSRLKTLHAVEDEVKIKKKLAKDNGGKT